ncbi:hypothetical protein LR48_Vigan04g145200 [Vigna angularis]|uniref:Uncharacterized protein n=1 Tax=Phaseolus angularis TaxID=3914 RepID=A0A0L9UFD2_PHAAN|nr:hypothetical protein LR48_Vigan04g145200 [Vigna angularis]
MKLALRGPLRAPRRRTGSSDAQGQLRRQAGVMRLEEVALSASKREPRHETGLPTLRAPEKGQPSVSQCNIALRAPKIALSVAAFLIYDAFPTLPEFQLLTTSNLLPNHLNSC